MSSSINDPAAVAALLDQLRASQAWQQAVLESSRQAQSAPETSSSANDQPRSDPATAEITDASQSHKGPSVADLLAQLKSPSVVAPPPPNTSAPWDTPATNTRPASTSLAFPNAYAHQPYPSASSSIESPAPPPSLPDLRSCTFQEALPLLSRLADDPAFVTSIREMRNAQDSLERQLLTEREAIQKKFADKVKVAKTKANMVGVSISKHEASMLQDAYQRELRKFDTERLLPAWDGLLAQQQAKLESLRVPSMFVTSDRKDIERQKQVIQVVFGLVQ